MVAHEVFQHGDEEIVPADQREFRSKKRKPLEAEFNRPTTGTRIDLEMHPLRPHGDSVTQCNMHDMPVLNLASSECPHRVKVLAENTHNPGLVDTTFLAKLA